MKNSSKLVMPIATAITLSMAALPVMAAGSINNSGTWTTTNGSAVVDSSGNPVRTIHYLDTAPKPVAETTKKTTPLLTAIKKAVAKILKEDPEPALTPEPVTKVALLVEPEPEKEIEIEIVDEQPIQEPVKAVVVTAEEAQEVAAEPVQEPVQEQLQEQVEEVAAVVAEDVAEVIEPLNVEYSFNDYLATILFDTNSATISDDGVGSLAQLAMATRKADRVLSVKLFGYADSRGDHDYNMALSQKRMLSVEEFLNGQNLNVTSRFARGETSPILGNEGEDLALSRRVDVAIKTRHIKD